MAHTEYVNIHKDVFSAIRSEISNNVGAQIPQPILIIGPEGTGKTTLLRQLYEICFEHNPLWIDGRFLFNTSDILEPLEDQKHPIVFIDDWNFYLTRCSFEEQYRLRRFLYNEGAPMLIATANRILPAIAEYSAPFFEGLKVVYLNPIKEEVLSDQFKNPKELERATVLWKLLPPTIQSLNLTKNILLTNPDAEKDIDCLLSILASQYYDLYSSLSTYSQKILNALSKANTGMTLREMRVESGLPTNILTAYLKRLNTMGVIGYDRTIKRGTRYFIKDSLLSKWLSRSCP